MGSLNWVIVFCSGETVFLGKVDSSLIKVGVETDLYEARIIERFSQPVKGNGGSMGMFRLQTLSPLHCSYKAVNHLKVLPVAYFFPDQQIVEGMIEDVRLEEKRVEDEMRASSAGIVLPRIGG